MQLSKIVFIIGFLLVGFSLSAQTIAPSVSEDQLIQNELEKIKGTYQIEMSVRGFPSYPSDFADLVSKNRLENKTNYVELSPYVKVKILSLSEIKKSDFIPVKDEIIYRINP